jgi:TP901 family phage tail tape measure protein
VGKQERIDLVIAAQNETSAELKRIVDDMGKVEKGTRKATEKQAHFGKVAKRTASGAGKSFKRLRGEVLSLDSALAGLGAALSVDYVLDQFATLDDGLIGIKKTTGLSGDALAGLGEDIQQLTTSIPATTGELVAIAQAAGQLGVQGRDDILAFTETVGMLGMATDMKGEQAATTLARMLNVAGEAAGEVDTLGAVIVALGNQFAATESEIAAVGTEVGQATAAFEVSSAEAAALGAALKSMGVRAELGGSAVGRVFRAIDASLRAGGDQLRELERLTGRTGAELRRIFATDSPEAFRVFVAGLGDVIDRGGSAAAELEKFGLKGEEILKVLPTIATRSDEVGRALRIALQEVKNGTALTDEATEASKSFRKQMDLTRNTLNMAAADIGEELAPAVLEASQGFRKFVTENKDDFAEFGKDVASFADSLKPLGEDIGNLFSTTLKGWNSLPTIIQEMGLVGALVGGTKARVAIALVVAAAGQLQKLTKQVEGVSEADKLTAVMHQEQVRLAKLQETYADLRGIDKETFGPRYLRDIAAAQEHIKELQAAIEEMAQAEVAASEKAAKAVVEAEQKKHSAKAASVTTTVTPTATKQPEPPVVAAQSSDAPSFLASAFTDDFQTDIDKWAASQLAGYEIDTAAFSDAIAKQKQALADFHTEYVRATQGETALAEEAARAQAEAWERAGADRLQVQEWLSAKLEGVEEQRLAASREAADGMARALDAYIDEASNAAAQTEQIFGGGLRSLEDQLVNVCTTGKFAWRDMVTSWAADLSRMMIQQSITGPLAKGLSGAIGGMFGGGGAQTDFSSLRDAGLTGYANGGVSTSPQLAWVSEGRYPMEAHVPLPDGRAIPVNITTPRAPAAPTQPQELKIEVINESGKEMRVARTQQVQDTPHRTIARIWMEAVEMNTEGLGEFTGRY